MLKIIKANARRINRKKKQQCYAKHMTEGRKEEKVHKHTMYCRVYMDNLVSAKRYKGQKSIATHASFIS